MDLEIRDKLKLIGNLNWLDTHIVFINSLGGGQLTLIR